MLEKLRVCHSLNIRRMNFVYVSHKPGLPGLMLQVERHCNILASSETNFCEPVDLRSTLLMAFRKPERSSLNMDLTMSRKLHFWLLPIIP